MRLILQARARTASLSAVARGFQPGVTSRQRRSPERLALRRGESEPNLEAELELALLESNRVRELIRIGRNRRERVAGGVDTVFVVMPDNCSMLNAFFSSAMIS